MKIHFAVYRTYSGNEDRLKKFLSFAGRNQKVSDWTATGKFEQGDLVLFYFGKPVMSIVAVGVVASKLHRYEGPFDWSEKNELFFCDFKPVWLLDCPIFLPDAVKRIGLQSWYNTKPYRSSHELNQEVATSLLSEISRVNSGVQERIRKIGVKILRAKKQKLVGNPKRFEEGGIKEITHELRTRNPLLRTHALARYGYRCKVCDFDFEEFYGDWGAGYIEVHHLHPLSARKRKNTTTIKGVTVVCANCHRVLHRNGKKPISLSKLRKAVLNQRQRELESRIES